MKREPSKHVIGVEHQYFIHEVIQPKLAGSTDKNISAVTYDLEGKIIHATNVFAKIFGYVSWEDIIGKTISDIVVLSESGLIDTLTNI